MMSLFVHSYNIRRRFAFIPKVYDNVIFASNANFRAITDLAMTARSMEFALVAKYAL